MSHQFHTITRSDAEFIYNAMRQATLDHLYGPRRSWASAHGNDVLLRIRLGNASNTHLRTIYKNGVIYSFEITYGQGLMDDSFCSERTKYWLSYTEMSERYFDGPGKFTPLDHLAHIVCHEFCHWVQSITDSFEDGVHGKEFYEILDKCYESNSFQIVKSHIRDSLRRKENIFNLFELNYDGSTPPKPKLTVGVSGRYLDFIGKVQKINPQTVILVNHNGDELRAPISKIEFMS